MPSGNKDYIYQTDPDSRGFTWIHAAYAHEPTAGLFCFARTGGEDLPPDVLAKLKEADLTPFVTHQVKLDYDYFTAEQILKVVPMSSPLCVCVCVI